MAKYTKLYAPVDGVVKDITTVDDPVFAQKLVGDGIAITPTSNIICSPCNGTVNHIFQTNHAFTMISEDNAEVLLHLGIDTVDLKGEGFERLLPEGKTDVTIGEPIIKMDIDYIKLNKKSTDIMIILTNADKMKLKKRLKKQVSQQDEVIKYALR